MEYEAELKKEPVNYLLTHIGGNKPFYAYESGYGIYSDNYFSLAVSGNGIYLINNSAKRFGYASYEYLYLDMADAGHLLKRKLIAY